MIPEEPFKIDDDERKLTVHLRDATVTYFKQGNHNLICVCKGSPVNDLIKCLQKVTQITGKT